MQLQAAEHQLADSINSNFAAEDICHFLGLQITKIVLMYKQVGQPALAKGFCIRIHELPGWQGGQGLREAFSPAADP